MGSSVRIKEFSFGYEKKTILEEINFQFEQGHFYSIVGPNGSGKTTLLKHIAKILEVSKDKIFIEDCDIHKLKGKNFARKIALVPQNTEVEFQFSVEDIVMMGRSPYVRPLQKDSDEDKERVFEAMKLTNTFQLKDKSIAELSGGERQRVIVARALVQDTPIILLDEPISHLDLFHQIEILNIIKNLNLKKKITVIAVLHDLNLAIEYSDEIIFIGEGEIKASGKPRNIINIEIIKMIYGIDVVVIENPVSGKPHIIPIVKGSTRS
ncbi:ABC transporter related [Clostridium cellulovorans 743B]|uniref:ABC transporter related n=2 Tax=Clostridium cellulovorans TaxID=1493 RepID=D9SL05_CLOC7|nr:ABC transporter related [Clostridium cellulovorans 743B]